jgi:transcriptional regulator with XRE-family HTH domain
MAAHIAIMSAHYLGVRGKMLLSARDELARTIKGIRLRLGMNMTKFAQAIGVTQGQVNRYEANRAVPSTYTLANLLPLADGAEKNPILECLTKMLGSGPMTEAATISKVADERKRFDAMWAAAMASQPTAETPLPFWANLLGVCRNETQASGCGVGLGATPPPCFIAQSTK